MKYIKLSLLCVLGLQSMMMQAAVESKDDYQDKHQAIIDDAMQPENYINLKSGFAFLQSQGLNVPSFHDVLEQNVPQSDDEDLDLHAITAQAENILTLSMKKPFIATLDTVLKEDKALDHINDPLFVYVMQHKDDYMKDLLHSWLYEWSKSKDYLNNTPLHNAANKNNAEIVRMLINAGADVNIQSSTGEAPLHIATNKNNAEIVRMLINAGADVNIQSSTVRMLINANADVNIQSSFDRTPLHNAAENNNTEIVRILLTAGADANIQNSIDRTPLHMAIEKNNAEIVRMLINANADVNVQDKYDEAPLHNAAKKNNAEIVRILLDAGANVNIQDNDGSTPLHVATWNNSKEVERILIDAGANVNIQDNAGRIAKQLARSPQKQAADNDKEKRIIQDLTKFAEELAAQRRKENQVWR